MLVGDALAQPTDVDHLIALDDGDGGSRRGGCGRRRHRSRCGLRRCGRGSCGCGSDGLRNRCRHRNGGRNGRLRRRRWFQGDLCGLGGRCLRCRDRCGRCVKRRSWLRWLRGRRGSRAGCHEVHHVFACDPAALTGAGDMVEVEVVLGSELAHDRRQDATAWRVCARGRRDGGGARRRLENRDGLGCGSGCCRLHRRGAGTAGSGSPGATGAGAGGLSRRGGVSRRGRRCGSRRRAPGQPLRPVQQRPVRQRQLHRLRR